MGKLRHLQGMRDLPQESWLRLKDAQERLREFFSSHGYRLLETPVLEPTELFLRKSGGELAARMYTFTDPGGHLVSLRPEYTASIIRHFLEGGADYQKHPLRVQYAGPVFRHSREADGQGQALRQFTQVGAELLNVSGPKADAEVLSLSVNALSCLGIVGHRLVVGDLELVSRLLGSLGLSERAMAFILGSMQDIARGEEGRGAVEERAAQLRLLESGPRQGYLRAALGDMEEEQARELLHGLLEWSGAESLGQRQPSQVVERLLRKFRGTDDAATLQRGLDMAYSLATVKGEPVACLESAAAIVQHSRLGAAALDPLKEVVDLLGADLQAGAGLELDFGLARGLAYYTGIVFEIVHPGFDAPLGGGGRYDGLARALGSPSEVPALGFAYTLEQLLDVLGDAGGPQQPEEAAMDSVLVASLAGDAYKVALKLAGELRRQGTRVEMEVSGLGLQECLSYARARGIREVVSVHASGRHTRHATQPPSEVNSSSQVNPPSQVNPKKG